jgi:hypothetical protein
VKSELAPWQNALSNNALALCYFLWITGMARIFVQSMARLLPFTWKSGLFGGHPFFAGAVVGLLAASFPYEQVATGLFDLYPEQTRRLRRFRKNLRWVWIALTLLFLGFSAVEASVYTRNSVFTDYRASWLQHWVDMFVKQPCLADPSLESKFLWPHECRSNFLTTYWWLSSLTFSAVNWIIVRRGRNGQHGLSVAG